MNQPSGTPLFVIDPNPIVSWPVTVRLPVAGGEFADFRFPARIRVLSAADYAALAPADTGDDAPTMAEILRRNVPVCQALVVGGDDIRDADGNLVPYTPEKLAEQITGPYGAELSAGLWLALREIRAGVRLGNSAPPPAAG